MCAQSRAQPYCMRLHPALNHPCIGRVPLLQIGLVSQQPVLFASTIFENISLSTGATMEQVGWGPQSCLQSETARKGLWPCCAAFPAQQRCITTACLACPCSVQVVQAAIAANAHSFIEKLPSG